MHIKETSLVILRKNNSYYAILKMKIVSTAIRTAEFMHGLWVELSTTELFDLLSGYKINVYQIPMSSFTNQSSVHVHMSQND